MASLHNFFINGHLANPNNSDDQDLVDIMVDLLNDYNNYPMDFDATFIQYNYAADPDGVQHTCICIETNIPTVGLVWNPITNPNDPKQISDFLEKLIDWDAYINQDEGFYDVTYTAGFNSDGKLNIYIHYTI